MPVYDLPVHPDHIRSITDPHRPTIKTYYVLVNIRDFPRDLSLSPDPRVPKESRVTSRIVNSLKQWDGNFHILNRGIAISAKEAEYDNIKRSFKLVIPDDESNYGILDGGHTTFSIESVLDDNLPEEAAYEQYVRFEILLGVEEILGKIASARNFSEKVKDISLANYEKKLDWLKASIAPFSDQIRWSENDPGKKIDALELIQILTAMNPGQFGPNDYPLEAYKNAGKCLDYITDKDDKYGYKKLSGVTLDIWRLYDTIRHQWWEMYRLPDPITGKYGRPGRTVEVQARKRGHAKLMHYVTLGIDGSPEAGDKHVERGLVMPLLAGFRVLLNPGHDGMYHWSEDPIKFFNRHGQTLVRKLMDASDQRDNNPHTVGRDKTVYAQIFDAVELERLREWKDKQVTNNIGVLNL